MKRLLERPALLLVLGCALIVAAHFRWGVGVLAWIAPVPLLRFLRLTCDVRSRVTFAVALCAAWIAATAKIVTAPVPFVAALPMGFLAAVFNLAAYFAWDWSHRRVPPGLGVLVFPAAVVPAQSRRGCSTILRLARNRSTAHSNGSARRHRRRFLSRPLHPLRVVRDYRSAWPHSRVALQLRGRQSGAHGRCAASPPEHGLRKYWRQSRLRLFGVSRCAHRLGSPHATGWTTK